MTSRERFTLTMLRRQPDRPPFDIGATSLTAMNATAQKSLLRLLGFPGDIQTGGDGGVDERILVWADADFRSVGSVVDLPSTHAHGCRHGGETTAAISDVTTDCWGVRRKRIGENFQIVGHPLAGSSAKDLKSFQWPDAAIPEKKLSEWEAKAKRLKSESERVIVAEHPFHGMFELGCWMCGYEDFMTKTLLDHDYVRFFFEKVCSIQERVIEQYYSALGPYVDVTTSADDFGGQSGPLLSPETFEKLVAPFFKAQIARIKELTGRHHWHHTCGSVFDLLGLIADCGVDILNPVQVFAAGMEPQRLKRFYGERLVFWGGVDIRNALLRLPSSRINEEIARLADVLGTNGGYVMAPAEDIREDIPPEKIVAWVDAVRRL